MGPLGYGSTTTLPHGISRLHSSRSTVSKAAPLTTTDACHRVHNHHRVRAYSSLVSTRLTSSGADEMDEMNRIESNRIE